MADPKVAVSRPMPLSAGPLNTATQILVEGTSNLFRDGLSDLRMQAQVSKKRDLAGDTKPIGHVIRYNDEDRSGSYLSLFRAIGSKQLISISGFPLRHDFVKEFSIQVLRRFADFFSLSIGGTRSGSRINTNLEVTMTKVMKGRADLRYTPGRKTPHVSSYAMRGASYPLVKSKGVLTPVRHFANVTYVESEAELDYDGFDTINSTIPFNVITGTFTSVSEHDFVRRRDQELKNSLALLFFITLVDKVAEKYGCKAAFFGPIALVGWAPADDIEQFIFMTGGRIQFIILDPLIKAKRTYAIAPPPAADITYIPFGEEAKYLPGVATKYWGYLKKGKPPTSYMSIVTHPGSINDIKRLKMPVFDDRRGDYVISEEKDAEKVRFLKKREVNRHMAMVKVNPIEGTVYVFDNTIRPVQAAHLVDVSDLSAFAAWNGNRKTHEGYACSLDLFNAPKYADKDFGDSYLPLSSVLSYAFKNYFSTSILALSNSNNPPCFDITSRLPLCANVYPTEEPSIGSLGVAYKPGGTRVDHGALSVPKVNFKVPFNCLAVAANVAFKGLMPHVENMDKTIVLHSSFTTFLDLQDVGLIMGRTTFPQLIMLKAVDESAYYNVRSTLVKRWSVFLGKDYTSFKASGHMINSMMSGTIFYAYVTRYKFHSPEEILTGILVGLSLLAIYRRPVDYRFILEVVALLKAEFKITLTLHHSESYFCFVMEVLPEVGII